jgi:Uma2 family endonuclease
MAAKTGLTVRDLANLEPPDGVKYELSDGALITVVRKSTYLHEWVRWRVNAILSEYARRKRTGIIGVESLFTLSEGTARQPEVAFISNAKVRPVTSPDELIPFVPDLAVEVVSESDSIRDAETKVREYFAAGVEEVWQVLPEHRAIHVRTKNAMRELNSDDVIETPVLAGFRAKVSEFFPQ